MLVMNYIEQWVKVIPKICPKSDFESPDSPLSPSSLISKIKDCTKHHQVPMFKKFMALITLRRVFGFFFFNLLCWSLLSSVFWGYFIVFFLIKIEFGWFLNQHKVASSLRICLLSQRNNFANQGRKSIKNKLWSQDTITY